MLHICKRDKMHPGIARQRLFPSHACPQNGLVSTSYCCGGAVSFTLAVFWIPSR